MKTHDYIEILRSGKQPIPQPFVHGICGRVIRGTKPSDFDTLTDDPSRHVIMLMDADGLARLFGKSGYKILIEIGYRADYIQQKLDAGNAFKLAVFPAEAAYLADWDGVFRIAAEVYPELASCCAKHASMLRSLTGFALTPGQTDQGHFIHEIERLAGYQFKDADKKDDPRFMSIEKYRSSGKSLWELRALLYHTLHLRELYSGDGYTYNEQGRRQLKEYVMRNKRIKDIQGSSVLDLDVTVP